MVVPVVAVMVTTVMAMLPMGVIMVVGIGHQMSGHGFTK
jgi:hypothetical protein